MNSFSYVPHVHRQNQDVFIDMQHANHSCESTIEFAEQPWKHCTDHTNCYLGLRFDKREEFKMQMRQLDAKKLKRIEHEEQRIEQTRVNFASYSKKERMMGRLKRARVEWKLEVKAKRQEYIEFIKHQDSARARYPKQWCRNHQLDLDLLARVASWTTDDKPENPALKALAEEEYGFRASAIYFKRSDHGWQPDTHANPHFLPEGKFPNQKIRVHDLLKDVENNPLSEPCEDGRMRYFHFPSNNMRWIEVCQVINLLELVKTDEYRKLWLGTTMKILEIIVTRKALTKHRQKQKRSYRGSSGEAKSTAEEALGEAVSEEDPSMQGI